MQLSGPRQANTYILPRPFFRAHCASSAQQLAFSSVGSSELTL